MASSYLCYSTPCYPGLSKGITVPVDIIRDHPAVLYFVRRNNGLSVPLIPADELPFSMKLQGVPRTLSPDQTYGLQCCGTAAHTGLTFQLDHSFSNFDTQPSSCQPPSNRGHGHDQSTSESRRYWTPDADDRQRTANTLQLPSVVRPISRSFSVEAAKSWRRTGPVSSNTVEGKAGPAQSIFDTMLRTESGTENATQPGHYLRSAKVSSASGVIPDQDKKEYCTYWILHGDCAYVQQGCRYKHEMPDKVKLSEIGINHVPRWWVERNTAFGSGRGTTTNAGQLKKPLGWLSFSDGSTSSESSVETTNVDVMATDTTDQSNSVLQAEKEGTKQGLTLYGPESDGRSPLVPPTRPSSPAESLRRPSSGSDLIDFGTLFPVSLSSAAPSASLSVSAAVPRRCIKKPCAAKTRAYTSKPAAKTNRGLYGAAGSATAHIETVKMRNVDKRLAHEKSSRKATLTHSSKV